MSLSDPIGDMIARVKNAQERNHKKVDLPSSNFKIKISDILKNEGFIKDFKINSENNKSIFIDFLPSGPSIFRILPARATLTFSGIEIFILPILDIKIPYKLFHHQLFVFLHLYQSLLLLELTQ